MDLSPPPPPPRAPEAPPAPEPVIPKAQKKTVLDELVDDDLVARLVEEYGLDTVKLHSADLMAPGLKPLSVEFRALKWDDFNWGLAAVQQRVKSGVDASYMQTDTQRTQFYKALTSCRCVLKIDGKWVWDLFKTRSDILSVNPAWSGDTHIGIPDFFIGAMAQKIFDLFRHKLHYDLLFELDNAVRDISSKDENDETKDKAEEDPTKAA